MQEAPELSREDIIRLVRNGFEAVFIDTQHKLLVLQELEDYVVSH